MKNQYLREIFLWVCAAGFCFSYLLVKERRKKAGRNIQQEQVKGYIRGLLDLSSNGKAGAYRFAIIFENTTIWMRWVTNCDITQNHLKRKERKKRIHEFKMFPIHCICMCFSLLLCLYKFQRSLVYTSFLLSRTLEPIFLGKKLIFLFLLL